MTLKVYNTLGQEVATAPDNEEMEEGEQKMFSTIGGSVPGGDASTFPSGVYYYRIVVNDVQGERVLYTRTGKMVLAK